jgi:hypothetical protein
MATRFHTAVEEQPEPGFVISSPDYPAPDFQLIPRALYFSKKALKTPTMTILC